MAMQAINPLLGTWHLQSWVITYSDGREATLPYGQNATGLILYSGDGWMNACIARAARAPLSGESLRHAPVEQRLSTLESFFQYAGRYELRQQAGKQQVVHSVTHAMNPNFVGTQQVRNVDFDAQGDLTLSASDALPGSSTVQRHHRLCWTRRILS